MNKKGFTLIELLVVIAIIGILAAVVLVNVNSARARARDTALKAGVNQMRLLMEQEFDARNSYAAANYGDWYSNESQCDTQFGSTANPQGFRAACKSIVRNTGTALGVVRLGVFTPGGTSYSIMAAKQDGTVYCAGSSGATTDNIPYNAGVWGTPGCINNP